MKKQKRTNIRKITLESRIIRFMRLSRGITVREAGRRINMSDSLVSHFETGRSDLSEARIQQLVSVYGFAMKDFDEYRNGKPLPALGLKEDCINLLECIDEPKLRAVHAMLTSFLS